MSLVAWSIELPHSIEREQTVAELRSGPEPRLVLDTCQRLEVYERSTSAFSSLATADQSWTDVEAFERLARIAAGLESRVLGELEVLGQVRSAYKVFRDNDAKQDRSLDRFFQDALSLARKARRHSGIDREVTSLSGLAGQAILDQVNPGTPIAVIGAGSLASNIIRFLGKRNTSPVRVSSRCPDTAMSLASSVGGFGAGLDKLAPMLRDVAGLVCATAAPHPVVYPHHLKDTQRPLHVVDLGVPADCNEEICQLEFVAYTGLEQVEAKAQINLAERKRRSHIATQIIHDGAIMWAAKH